MGTELPYGAFASLLVELRKKAGISQQSDLARELGTSQQTVSRWELGQSRPRAKQMPALAEVLESVEERRPDVLNRLMVVASYQGLPTVVSFDQPFPVDALSPESFERFIRYFLDKRFALEGGSVNPVGGTGHTQDGIDVEVTFPDGHQFGFQCKRVREFGPQKVDAAVAKYQGAAEKKFLVLSRVASPQARQSLRKYEGWELWDKEDLSLKIRELPKEEQRKLVDIFFPTQRLALLGETEPGPWQTDEQFFAPFTGRHSAFHHLWELVGRSEEKDELVRALHDEGVRLVSLVGAGGVGKSRVLKEAVSEFQTGYGGLVRFLSPTGVVDSRSLEDLGTGPKLLVVDDAHDRAELDLLFQYVACPGSNAKLLLAFRPYGRDYLLAQAGKFAVNGSLVKEVRLDALSLRAAEELARQVLAHFNGPLEAAEDIARLTRDCALATVVGAQIVAKERRHLELLKNEDEFRATLMAKFRDVIAGDISDKGDAASIKRLLRVLSLVQPFNPEDRELLGLAAEVEKIENDEVARLVRLLTQAGVIFRRGGLYRLSPDMLADYILEEECVGIGGTSTGYAERVFEAASDRHAENLIVNLGKLDWRRANGNPADSRLLDGIWGRLRPKQEYGDPYINAVTSVAFYQPNRALDFVTKLIREGAYLRDLPQILKNISYNLEHLPDACECLWFLARTDERQNTGPYPNHPIRVLRELCEVRSEKPRAFIEAAIEFGLNLLDREESWTGTFTPFDFLSGVLATEGHEATSNRRTVTFTRFTVSSEFVVPLRKKVVNAILRLLSHENDRAALAAAKALGEAVRYPMDGGREAWIEEFAGTLRSVSEIVSRENLKPLTWIEIARSISWHAQYGDDEVAEIAKGIVRKLPSTLEFKTTLALLDGYGVFLRRFEDYDAELRELSEMQDAVIAELGSRFSKTTGLLDYVYGIIKQIHLYERSASPHPFLHRLFAANPAVAEAVIRRSLQEPSEIDGYVATALASLIERDRKGAEWFVSKLLDAPRLELVASVGHAFNIASFPEQPNPREIEILRRLLESTDPRAVVGAVLATRRLAQRRPRLALDLLINGNLGVSDSVADQALMLLKLDNGELYDALTEDDVRLVLAKLSGLPELNGHWVETFLAHASKRYPDATADFFMARVEQAGQTEDWKLRPCNFGPYMHVPLKFREAENSGRLLRRVAAWLASKPDAPYLFHHRAAELFSTMFAPFDATFITFLRDWTNVAQEEELRLISCVIREAPTDDQMSNDFVFRESEFVVQLVEKAAKFGPECRKAVSSNIFGMAISGMRSGTPGEPFPSDLKMKERAAAMLGRLPRVSPAYDLYESLLKHAEWGISEALKEREAFEE